MITQLLDRFFRWLASLLPAPIPQTWPVVPEINPPAPPMPPVVLATTTPPVEPPALDWSTPHGAYHATRVLCDSAGLTVDQKNLICACIYQESEFRNDVHHSNRTADGSILSTDWGIVQINDYYHVGPGKDFPSIAYVQANPDKAVVWMITMYKHGMLKQWVSFSSGAYRQWLAPGSPMWKLAN